MISEQDKEQISSFSSAEWSDWVLQRVHGRDTWTGMDAARDPNPHLAVISAYNSIKTEERIKPALVGRVEALGLQLGWLQKKLSSNMPLDDSLEEALGAIRLVKVFGEVDLAALTRCRLVIRVRTYLRDFQSLADERAAAQNEYSQLQMLVFGVRSRFNDRISLRLVKNFLGLPNACVVAFRHAVKAFGLEHIENFLVPFVSTAWDSKKTTIKLELIRLLDIYGTDIPSRHDIREGILKTMKRLDAPKSAYIQELVQAIGMRIPIDRTVKLAIQDRKPHEQARGILRVVSDSPYINSKLYREFCRTMTDSLANRNNATIESLKSDNYDHMAEEQFIHLIDFATTAYFLSPIRAHFINVVPIGTVKAFTLIVDPRFYTHILKTRLCDAGIPRFSDRLISFLQHYDKEQGNIHIGVYLGTTAANEVMHVLGEYAFSPELHRGVSAEDLANWLTRSDKKGYLVFCDFGIASEIDEHFPGGVYGRWQDYEEHKQIIFKYDNIMPIGFMYPEKDTNWCTQIIDAIAIALEEHWHNWKAIRVAGLRAGLDIYSLEGLVQNLGLVDFYNERIRPKRLEAAKEKEEYELAARLSRPMERLPGSGLFRNG